MHARDQRCDGVCDAEGLGFGRPTVVGPWTCTARYTHLRPAASPIPRTRRETWRSNDAASTAAPTVDVTTYLPYPTLPYPTLPYPTLPYPTLPYPIGVAALCCIGMGALLLRWTLRCNVLCFVDGLAYQSSVASSRSESSSIV